MRRCVYRKQLDLDTLVCTRGPNFPLSRLESRLICPACGSRRVPVVFEPPTNSRSLANDGGAPLAAMTYFVAAASLGARVARRRTAMAVSSNQKDQNLSE